MSKILVVDDTPNIRKMVHLTLVSVGHSVEIAADGAQGLEVSGDGTGFDLTLVDQHMPNIEGREMIAQARKRDPMARLIMITAFASSELGCRNRVATRIWCPGKDSASKVWERNYGQNSHRR